VRVFSKFIMIYFGKFRIVEINYRLPTNLKPFEYEIYLKPYIGEAQLYGNRSFTFDGQVRIFYTCLEPTSKIVLHELDLQIKRVVHGSQRQSQEIPMSQIEHDATREFLIINLRSNCQTNANYTLKIDYIGYLSTSLAGFYRSSYLDKNKTLN
jgi:hypothetical protein